MANAAKAIAIVADSTIDMVMTVMRKASCQDCNMIEIYVLPSQILRHISIFLRDDGSLRTAAPHQCQYKVVENISASRIKRSNSRRIWAMAKG